MTDYGEPLKPQKPGRTHPILRAQYNRAEAKYNAAEMKRLAETARARAPHDARAEGAASDASASEAERVAARMRAENNTLGTLYGTPRGGRGAASGSGEGSVLDERRTWFGRATDAIFISHFFPLQFTHGSVERDIPDDQARDALRMSRRAALVSYAVGAVVLPFNPLLGGTFLAMGKSIDVGVARGAMRALPPAP